MCKNLPIVKYEMLGLAAKYGLSDVREGLSTISDSVSFVQRVQLWCNVIHKNKKYHYS